MGGWVEMGGGGICVRAKVVGERGVQWRGEERGEERRRGEE